MALAIRKHHAFSDTQEVARFVAFRHAFYINE
jgi:hypothetical protein